MRANAYAQLYVHIVFAVKYRRALIGEEIREETERYIAGVIEAQGCTLLQIYCMPDHLHALVRFRTTTVLAKLVNAMKANSSRWLKTVAHPDFAWQDGGGYFSVSQRAVHIVARYIRNQAEHHRRKAFLKEYTQLLEENGVDYDPRFPPHPPF